jgi:hypothetical protein
MDCAGGRHLALTGRYLGTYADRVSFLAPSSTIPRELRPVATAGATGLSVGVIAAGVAYAAYLRTGGPTLAGAVIIPLSVLVVAVLRVLLAKRRQTRASDWVVVGYAGGIVLATMLLTVAEVLQAIYDDFGGVAF